MRVERKDGQRLQIPQEKVTHVLAPASELAPWLGTSIRWMKMLRWCIPYFGDAARVQRPEFIKVPVHGLECVK